MDVGRPGPACPAGRPRPAGPGRPAPAGHRPGGRSKTLVHTQLHSIAKAVEVIADKFREGGRLVYVGCGTSGRLGILDASECEVTFGVGKEVVVGVMGGGREAVFESREAVEDSYTQPVQDLKTLNLTEKDVVVGIAASGRTPYVLGGVEWGRGRGCVTVGVSCNPSSPLHSAVDIPITPVVGAEVLTGSTRMKAGTAQKMVLNMLSTGAMVRLGKCYGNFMVDFDGSACGKLRDRARRVIRTTTRCSPHEADTLAQTTNFHSKPAILMHFSGLELGPALELIAEHKGNLRTALTVMKKH